jgi:tRNA A37 threonylcarbamoyladenosine modification protein TsaB
MDNQLNNGLKLAFILKKTHVDYVIGYDAHHIIHTYTLTYEELKGAETFLPHLQHITKDLPSSILSVATYCGPGSITLSRIALSVAKGLSIGWRCALHTPSRFDLIHDFTIHHHDCLWTLNAYNGSFFTRVKKGLQILDLGLLSTEQLTEFVNKHAIHHFGEWHCDKHFKTFEEYEILFLFQNQCTNIMTPYILIN